MVDTNDIREGIKTVLEANLPSDRPTVYAYAASSMNPPAIIVRPRAAVRGAMGSAKRRQHEFSLFVVMTKGMEDANWEEALDKLLATDGADSIQEALYADKTLNGTAELVHVDGYDSYGEEIRINGIEYGGARMALEVWGKEPT